MKEKVKSAVLIVLMLISIAGIALTVNHAKENEQNKNIVNNQQIPPDMQGTTEDFGERPSVPNEFDGQKGKNEFEVPSDSRGNLIKGNTQLKTIHIAIIGAFSALFSLCFIYLIMSVKNKAFLKNKDKAIIFILSFALLTSYLTAGVSAAANRFVLKEQKMEEVQTEKDKVSLDNSNIANSESINLNNQKTDVTITDGGTYEFSGEFSNSIIIDSEDEDVELILNNVKITNNKTAAIIGLSAKSITINLKDATENTLSDGGNSEYDGCIFSNTELIFTGEGKLVVNGNQNEGEGIATEAADITINSGEFNITSNDDGINAGGDGATITINGGSIYIDASGDGIDSNKNAVINGGTLFVLGSDVGGDAGIDTEEGYVINGGTVVALGSDMIETPKNTGKQNTIAFSLNEKINKDTVVSLMSGDEAMITFTAPKGFKTIIISTDSLVNGEYQLYTEDFSNKEINYGIHTDNAFTKENQISVNNQNNFTVNSTVNSFGK